MIAYCEDCGAGILTCVSCGKQRETVAEECDDCYQGNPPSNPSFFCFTCKPRTLNWEVFKIQYESLTSGEALSPTTVHRTPLYRSFITPTDPLVRAAEARAAFDEEMNFTGDIEEATQIYRRFYPHPVSRTPIPKGFVPLQAIQQGTPVSGLQLFLALQAETEAKEGVKRPDLSLLSKQEVIQEIHKGMADHMAALRKCGDEYETAKNEVRITRLWMDRLYLELETKK